MSSSTKKVRCKAQSVMSQVLILFETFSSLVWFGLLRFSESDSGRSDRHKSELNYPGYWLSSLDICVRKQIRKHFCLRSVAFFSSRSKFFLHCYELLKLIEPNVNFLSHHLYYHFLVSFLMFSLYYHFCYIFMLSFLSLFFVYIFQFLFYFPKISNAAWN